MVGDRGSNRYGADMTLQGGLEQQKAQLQALNEKLSLLPLWEHYEKIVTTEPASLTPSKMWRWQELSAAVDIAAKIVKGHDADHRVFVLKNPHLPGRVATCTNILGAVQCVLPGEKTSAHRHSPAAVRIVLQGKGGSTFVDGLACPMHDGDFIATPSGTWHCHDNHSDEPLLWVDVLDVPLVIYMNSVFGDYGEPKAFPTNASTLPDETYGFGGLVPATVSGGPPYTSRFRYPRSEVKELLSRLSPALDGSRAVRYVDPLSGGPVTANLDAIALALAKNRPTARRRSTETALCVVLDGAGKSTIGDVSHAWERWDIFTIPEWQWASHEAGTETASLVVVSDVQVKRRLGLLREQTDG